MLDGFFKIIIPFTGIAMVLYLIGFVIVINLN